MVNKKIYLAGHDGMVGSALMRELQKQGCKNIVYKTIAELDLTNQSDTENFFEQEKPEVVIVAAADPVPTTNSPDPFGAKAKSTFESLPFADNLGSPPVAAFVISKKFTAEEVV